MVCKKEIASSILSFLGEWDRWGMPKDITQLSAVRQTLEIALMRNLLYMHHLPQLQSWRTSYICTGASSLQSVADPGACPQDTPRNSHVHQVHKLKAPLIQNPGSTPDSSLILITVSGLCNWRSL